MLTGQQSVRGMPGPAPACAMHPQQHMVLMSVATSTCVTGCCCCCDCYVSDTLA
jgi:hypothetical protein